MQDPMDKYTDPQSIRLGSMSLRSRRTIPCRARVNALLVTAWVALFLLCLFTQWVEAVCLELKDNVEVSGPEVLVCEVAAVRDASPSLSRRIQQLSMGRAPWPGNTRRIDRQALKVRLYQHGIAPEALEFAGAAETLVKAKSVVIAPRRVEELARRRLLEALPWPEEDLLVVAQSVREQHVPGDADRVTLRPVLEAGPQLAKKMQVNVRVYTGERLVKTIPVVFKVSAFKKAAVARTYIAREEQLSKANVTMRRIDVLDTDGVVMDNFGEVLGKVAAHPIRVGAPITDRMLTAPVAVRRGEPVKFVMEVKSLVIIGSALAQQQGRVGQTIRVRRQGTRKDLRALVTGPRTVTVAF